MEKQLINRKRGTFMVVLLSLFYLSMTVSVFAESEQNPVASANDTSKSALSYTQTQEGVEIQLEKKMLSPEPSPVVPAPPSPQTTAPTASETTDQKPAATDMVGDLDDPFKSASPDVPELKDPLVAYNRFMFNVNDKLYLYIMEPVARRYRDWVSEDVRVSIRNMFNNASSPAKFVSSVVQGDMNKASRAFGRAIINTTIGIGGLFDVADKHFHIDDVNEDFGQALGFRNVPTGPYLVIPIIGPSTARDAVGRVVDSFLSPTILLIPGIAAGMGVSAADEINRTSFIIDDIKGLDDSSVDKYEITRDFYHQYREGLVRK